MSATKHMSLFQQPARQPRFSGISHVSLPCRDLEESRIFYANVMGGKLVHSIQGFVEFRIEDIIIGLSEQSEGWTGPDDEYPHYAFYISGPNFELMKNWLDGYGVPNYPYRRGDTRLSTSAIRPAISSSFTAIQATRGYCLCH